MLSWLRRRGKIQVSDGKFVQVEEPGLRRGSSLQMQEVNLVYYYGGIGDYIYWTTAIDWVFSTHPHLHGSVLAPKFFYQLASHWLAHLSDRVEIRSYDNIEKDKFLKRRDKFFVIPNGHQMHNSMGAHLLDIGFRYYANLNSAPDGWMRMPKILGNEADISRLSLPDNYVVVTTEATSPIRKLSARAINEICEHLISRGVTPVFLGKRELMSDYKATADENISTIGVMDLREKTSLLEAACVLARAQAVVGLDNGLLHLASCSRVPVVMAFNTVDPMLRGPIRPSGCITVAIAPPKELECRFCESTTRYILGHNFKRCLYNDLKCVDTLNSKVFIGALSKILDHK